ncbi:hypothetical protein B0H13DRAFT_1850485 [Mycena leptocephala]|nr:hypothetical protein B0H13DRAFT_1850485 [Mycena leptocephala]
MKKTSKKAQKTRRETPYSREMLMRHIRNGRVRAAAGRRRRSGQIHTAIEFKERKKKLNCRPIKKNHGSEIGIYPRSLVNDLRITRRKRRNTRAKQETRRRKRGGDILKGHVRGAQRLQSGERLRRRGVRDHLDSERHGLDTMKLLHGYQWLRVKLQRRVTQGEQVDALQRQEKAIGYQEKQWRVDGARSKRTRTGDILGHLTAFQTPLSGLRRSVDTKIAWELFVDASLNRGKDCT